MGRDKRLDIVVSDSSGRRLALEVKCKTKGNAEQLERYAGEWIQVARVGFGEWNWDLTAEQQSHCPLITFSEVASMLAQALGEVSSAISHRVFLQELVAHLEAEAHFFTQLKAYFLGTAADPLPRPPILFRYSHRFYNELYWEWVKSRLDKEEVFPRLKWNIGSERSGVWFAHPDSPRPLTSGWIRRLALNPSAGVNWWIHVELLSAGVVATDENATAGRIQLRVEGDPMELMQVGTAIRGHSPLPEGFAATTMKSRGRSFNALTRPLRVKDFRYATLIETIGLLLNE